MDKLPNTNDSKLRCGLKQGMSAGSSSDADAAGSSSSSTCAAIGAHNIGSLRLMSGRGIGTAARNGVPTSAQAPSSSSNTMVGSLTEVRRRRPKGPISPAKLKFLMLGASGTGKTSLLRRLQNLNAVPDKSLMGKTIGPDLHRFNCGQVEAIDIGGAERLFQISQTYCDVFDVFVVMFDITSAESFLYAKYWLDYLEQRSQRHVDKMVQVTPSRTQESQMDQDDDSEDATSEPNSPVTKSPSPSRPVSPTPATILLIGNKKDLDSNNPSTAEKGKLRQVSKNLARNLAAAYNADYLEISARHDLNLSESIISTLERKCEETSKLANQISNC